MAERALAIDPDLAEAWATLASVEAQYGRDAARAEACWTRALELDPRHVRSRCERALWSVGLGTMSPEQAIGESALAAAEDPLNSWVAAQHGLILCYARRFSEAVASAERAVGIDENSFLAQWVLLQSRLGMGELQRALADVPALLSASGRHIWVLGTLAFLHARAGNPAAARAVFDEMEARSRSEYVACYWLATAASAAGLADLAVEFARRAIAERESMVVIARALPQWEALLSDSRLTDALREVWT